MRDRLPRRDELIVERRKIVDYLLCDEHPDGASKATLPSMRARACRSPISNAITLPSSMACAGNISRGIRGMLASRLLPEQPQWLGMLACMQHATHRIK
jgi:hypothetical protein